MRSALEATEGVEEIKLIPTFGTAKVTASDELSAETLLDIINEQDVTARLV